MQMPCTTAGARHYYFVLSNFIRNVDCIDLPDEMRILLS